jgi:hypothetical protein
MRPLSPAAAELTWAGASIIVCGVALALSQGGRGDPRAGAVGLAGAILVLWVLWGAGAVRRAIRLALPVRPLWALEASTATLARVLLTQTAPLAALAVGASALGAETIPGAPSAAAGALCGAGLASLLAAGRVRRAEEALGRRLLRRPRWGRLLDRRSLYLEPASPAARPSGSARAPWPSHRPPARPQRAAIELEPANGPARHAVGVGVRSLRRPAQRPPEPPPPGSS